MVDEELGTKRTCPSCATRFYDLNKDPIVCPACEESFIVEPILPSKTDSPAASKPAENEKEAAKDDDDDVEIISLEDADDDTEVEDDDEAAAIKDVDLGTEVEIDDDNDDDTFLEDDEDDDAPVSGLIGGGATKEDD